MPQPFRLGACPNPEAQEPPGENGAVFQHKEGLSGHLAHPIPDFRYVGEAFRPPAGDLKVAPTSRMQPSTMEESPRTTTAPLLIPRIPPSARTPSPPRGPAGGGRPAACSSLSRRRARAPP